MNGHLTTGEFDLIIFNFSDDKDELSCEFSITFDNDSFELLIVSQGFTTKTTSKGNIVSAVIDDIDVTAKSLDMDSKFIEKDSKSLNNLDLVFSSLNETRVVDVPRKHSNKAAHVVYTLDFAGKITYVDVGWSGLVDDTDSVDAEGSIPNLTVVVSPRKSIPFSTMNSLFGLFFVGYWRVKEKLKRYRKSSS
ncbi:MAG: hypothetical protein ACFFD4_20565 [Candidatus Odinarchaeota archaeon]